MDWHYIKTAAPGGYRQFQHWLLNYIEKEATVPTSRIRAAGYVPWLYVFFEKQGLMVNVVGCLLDGEAEYGYELQEDNTIEGIREQGYATRPEAEAAAFHHAFVLVDKKVTKSVGSRRY